MRARLAVAVTAAAVGAATMLAPVSASRETAGEDVIFVADGADHIHDSWDHDPIIHVGL